MTKVCKLSQEELEKMGFEIQTVRRPIRTPGAKALAQHWGTMDEEGNIRDWIVFPLPLGASRTQKGIAINYRNEVYFYTLGFKAGEPFEYITNEIKREWFEDEDLVWVNTVRIVLEKILGEEVQI